MAEALDRRIDELYAVPLDRFIPERDALAKELRSAGDREGADRVKAQRKPVVSAWALNRLAREDRATIDELAAAGTRLRDAQRRALSGGDTAALREASEERRSLVARVGSAARAVLERAGVDPGPHADDLTNTLEAAIVDADAAAALASGRLTKPLTPPSGLGDVVGLVVHEGGRRTSAPTAAEAEPGGRRRPTADPDAVAKAEREQQREWERERRNLEREVAKARTAHRRSAEAADRARRALEELERKRSDARTTARATEAEARGAALELKRLEARLARLEDRRR